MKNNGTFNYNYSAAQNKEIEHIRNRYMPHEESKIERLKKMDSQVQTAGMLPSLILGVIGCLIFGIGVCFFLGVFTTETWLTAFLMILGTVIMLPAYPLFRCISKKTKARLAPEILRLSEEIIKN